MEVIGENAFGFCTNLNELNFPKTINSIYKYAFRNCISLESVVIPGNDTIYAAFTDCSGIKTITVESNDKNIQYFKKNIFHHTYPVKMFIKNQYPPVVLKDTTDINEQKVTWDSELYSKCTQIGRAHV